MGERGNGVFTKQEWSLRTLLKAKVQRKISAEGGLKSGSGRGGRQSRG